MELWAYELKYQITSTNIWNVISCCFFPCKYITFVPSVRAVNMTTILTWERGRKSKIVVRDESWPGGGQYSARSHQWCHQVEPGESVTLGKPTRKKSAVFLNIVQKTFDPPPFVWTSCRICSECREWKFDIMYLLYPQISPSMPQKSLFMQISCC